MYLGFTSNPNIKPNLHQFFLCMHYTAQQIRLKITYKQLEQKQPKQPPDDHKITKFCAYIYDEINI